MPVTDEMLTTIVGRFENDIQRIGRDLLRDAVKAWQYEDFAITEETINVSADDSQYRLDLAADSAAWQGFQVGRVDAIAESGDQFLWQLDPGANHCETCLEYSAGGPYTLDELVTTVGIPGDAPTICDGGCRCNLIAA
jgi:hypothetical protein